MCANKFALHLPFLSWCAKKFALHDQNMRITVFSAVLGELFRGSAVGWAVLGELFRGRIAEGPHCERVYVSPQPLSPSLIGRGQISHAIPLEVFQFLNSNR